MKLQILDEGFDSNREGENDAGASPTSSDPAQKQRTVGRALAQILKLALEVVVKILNVVIKMRHTCKM
jgi:hypothetical protein